MHRLAGPHGPWNVKGREGYPGATMNCDHDLPPSDAPARRAPVLALSDRVDIHNVPQHR
jgi:hypothetical protein